MSICSICQLPFEDVDLRPYGPGGSLICYKCGTAPERVAETERRFGEMLDRASESGAPVIIGQPEGPKPIGRG